MKKSDYHMLVMMALIAPHMNVWVAVFLAILNFILACLWAAKE